MLAGNEVTALLGGAWGDMKRRQLDPDRAPFSKK